MSGIFKGPYAPSYYEDAERAEEEDFQTRLKKTMNPEPQADPVFAPSNLSTFTPPAPTKSVTPAKGPDTPASLEAPAWETPRIQDLQDELAEAKLRYVQNNDRLELREAIEKIAQGIGRFAAGWYGNKTNTDLSGVKFTSSDWDKKRERLDNQQAQIEADITRRRAERQGEADRRNQRGFQEYQTAVNRDTQNRQLDLADATRQDQVNLNNARLSSSESLSLKEMALRQLIAMDQQGMDQAKLAQQAGQFEQELGLKKGSLLLDERFKNKSLELDQAKFRSDSVYRQEALDESKRQAEVRERQADRSLDQADAKLDQDQRQFMTTLRFKYNELDQNAELKRDSNKLEQRRLELMEKQIDGNLANESRRIDAILAGQENDLKIAASKFAAARAEAAIKKAGTSDKQWQSALRSAADDLRAAEKMEDRDQKKNTVLNALAPLGVDTVEMEKASRRGFSNIWMYWGSDKYDHTKASLLIRKIANAPAPPAGMVTVLDMKAKGSDREYFSVTEEQYQAGLQANPGRLLRVRKSIYDPTESTP